MRERDLQMIEKHFSLVMGRSKWLLSYLLIIHGFMLLTMVLLLNSVYLLTLAVMIIVVSCITYCQQHQWITSHRSIIKIERKVTHQWVLFYANDIRQQNLDLKHCIVTPQVVILYFSGSSFWRVKSVVIVADAVDAELFRQLRTYCRNPKVFQR